MQNNFRKKTGTRIFNFVDEKNFENLNYQELKVEYNNITYQDFERQHRYVLDYLEEQDRDLLRKYFDGYTLRGYDNVYLEKEITNSLKGMEGDINLLKMSRKDIFVLLIRYGNYLADEIKIELMLKYGIKGRSIMSAYEVNRVYYILNKIKTEKNLKGLRLSKAFI